MPPNNVTMAVTPETAMLDSFQQMQNKNEMAEVMKELFDKSKLYMIGDLSKSEIKVATRIYMVAKMKKMTKWIVGLDFFMLLMLSHNRKSRKEILDAIRGYSTNNSFLGKMNPFNRGGQ